MPVSSREALTERIREIAERAAAREGLEVWDIEVLGSGRSRVVRIYIDKAAGATLADCELVSQQVGAVLDVEDVIPDQGYQLEVSSPGLERKLLKPEHFLRFTGQKIRVTLREPVEKQRRWDGVLTGFEDNCVALETGPGVTLRFRMDQIEKANLRFEW
jgi:ribosome maturation factor RimP